MILGLECLVSRRRLLQHLKALVLLLFRGVIEILNEALVSCGHFDLLERIYADLGILLLQQGRASSNAIIFHIFRFFSSHNLGRQVCFQINLKVAEHASLNDLVPFLAFKQACAHRVLSAPHKLDPADDFHLVHHFLVAHVNQLVLDGKALPAALANDRFEQPLEALTYTLPEADTNARPPLRFFVLVTEPLWLFLTDFAILVNIFAFSLIFIFLLRFHVILLRLLGEERMMTNVG